MSALRRVVRSDRVLLDSEAEPSRPSSLTGPQRSWRDLCFGLEPCARYLDADTASEAAVTGASHTGADKPTIVEYSSARA